jgi:hypothetical protein
MVPGEPRLRFVGIQRPNSGRNQHGTPLAKALRSIVNIDPDLRGETEYLMTFAAILRRGKIDAFQGVDKSESTLFEFQHDPGNDTFARYDGWISLGLEMIEIEPL